MANDPNITSPITFNDGTTTKHFSMANEFTGDGNIVVNTSDQTVALSMATDLALASITNSGTITSTGNVISSAQVKGATLYSTGNGTIGGALGVTGAITGASLEATGNVGGATLSSTGNATVGGNLTATGDVGADNITAGGDVTATGDVTANTVVSSSGFKIDDGSKTYIISYATVS